MPFTTDDEQTEFFEGESEMNLTADERAALAAEGLEVVNNFEDFKKSSKK